MNGSSAFRLERITANSAAMLVVDQKFGSGSTDCVFCTDSEDGRFAESD